MTHDMVQWSDSLREERQGFWTVPGAVSYPASGAVSYPASGHVVNEEVERSSFWFRHRNHCIVRVVRRFPPDGAILDLGGGTGVVSEALAAEGWQVTLLEPTSAGVEAGLRKSGFDVIHARFEDVSFKPESVAAMGLFDVLEHVPDDVGFLRGLHRALTPGGLLYLTVPAYPVLWSDADIRAGHHRRYSRKKLLATLGAAEFEILFETFLFSFLPSLTLLVRVLPYRLGLSRNATLERTRRQHSLPGGPIRGVLESVLALERERVTVGRLGFGGSLLAVARKAPVNTDLA